MSGRLQILAVLWVLSTASSSVIYGEGVTNFVTCIANAGIPVTVRSEGFAELTSDIVLNCQGGTPTPLGSPIPTSDITIYYNTQVTSRLLIGSGRSEAILTIDEPLASQTGAAQACTAAGGCAAIGAGPNISANSSEFKASFNSTTGQSCTPGTANCVLNPNVFQGTVSGNSVTFAGVPIDPPGTQGGRIYRITNVRADATVPAPGANGTPGQLIALVAAAGALPGGGLAINNSTQIVAFIQPSLSVTVRNAANSGSLTSPVPVAGSALTKVATLRFSELFATAFKRRTIPSQAANLADVTVAEQNTLGLVFNSETGYYNTRLGFTAGLADSGTRFKAVFSGVPAGVRLYVDAASQTGNQVNFALLTASETGAFSAVPATNGSAAEITLSNGTATAVWEYLSQSPLDNDQLDFGVYAMVSGNPATATIALNASYAPAGAVFTAGTALPRFLDTSTRISLISTGASSLMVTPPPALAIGVAGIAYGPVTLGASGGTPPYSWSTPAGSLPAGLALSAAGVLSGLPSLAGTTNFTATVTDNAGRTLAQNFSVNIVAPLAVVSYGLPTVTGGGNYWANFAAAGGIPPYSWTVIGGSFPAGLSLNPATGVISGIAPGAGFYNFVVRVADSIGEAANFSAILSITPPPVTVQTPPTLSMGVAGSPYLFSLSAGGGAVPFMWTLLSGGSLPPGLTLSASGLITGTPASAGTFTFSAQVRDAGGSTDRATFTLKINPPPLAISTAGPLPFAYVGSPYSQSFNATGGVSPYTWGISGVMSPGMSFSKAGVLSGTATAAGSYLFGVSLTDSAGTALGVNFTLTVLPPKLSITNSMLPRATVGSGYSATLTATGGTTPCRWSATGLPDGLSFDAATGSLSGSVQQPGTSTIKATVTDAGGVTASASLSFTANMPEAPAAQFVNLPNVLEPAAQPELQLALDSPYSFPIQGKIVLVFTPDSGPDDPAVQFAAGGRSADITIPTGQVAPVFTLPALALQTGTVAGKVELTVRLQSLGVAVGPAPTVWTQRVERRPPTITGMEVTWTPDGLTVSVNGYVTSRALHEARFRFDGGPEITVPLDVAFSQWLADPDSINYGSQFTLIQTFPDIDPAAATVSAVLVNIEGQSSLVTTRISPPLLPSAQN